MVSLTLTATALAIMTHINVNAMKHFFFVEWEVCQFFQWFNVELRENAMTYCDIIS
jgi:hypothetical protein